jgi:hypothetical protein
MRYLKKFNEELKSSTYKSAATKLKNIGHVRRSANMNDWVKKVESDEKAVRKMVIREEAKKSGIFKLDIYSNIYTAGSGYKKEKVLENLDFYIGYHINWDNVSDTICDFINDDQTISVPFDLFIVAPNNEVEDKMNSLEHIDNYDGKFWFDTIHIGINSKHFSLSQYDRYGFLFTDRVNANKFKRHLIENLEKNIDSMYGDIMLDYKSATNYHIKKDPEFKPKLIMPEKEEMLNIMKSSISVNKLYSN